MLGYKGTTARSHEFTLQLLVYIRWYINYSGVNVPYILSESGSHTHTSSYLSLPHLIFNIHSRPSLFIPFTLSLNVPLCPLSLSLFLPSCSPAVLPAMQTLKVNLHSKVLLLASATMTERFPCMPPLFPFLFHFLLFTWLLFCSHAPKINQNCIN